MSEPNPTDEVNGLSSDARPFSPVCLSCGFPRKGLGDAIVNCPECGVAWARVSTDVGWLSEVRWGLKLIGFGLVAWYALGAVSVPIGLLEDYDRKEYLLFMLRCAKAAALVAIWLGARRLVPVGPRAPIMRAAAVSIAALPLLFIAQCTGVFGTINSTVWGLTASRIDLWLAPLSSWVITVLEFACGAGLVVILGLLATNLCVRVRPAPNHWLALAIGFLAGVGRPVSQNLSQLLDYFFGVASTESEQQLRSLVDWYLDLFVRTAMLGIVLAIWMLWLVCSRAASRATSQSARGGRCDSTNP